MRDLVVLIVHLITTVFRLVQPGGVRAVVAESVLTKHQLLILNRARRRALGRYQILIDTAKSYGFTDFSPAGQDAAANVLMERRGMVKAALQGNIAQAIRNGG